MKPAEGREVATREWVLVGARGGAELGGQAGELGTSPKACRLFVPPIRELTVIKVEHGCVVKDPPVPQLAPPGIFNPPKERVKILDHFNGSPDNAIS